MAFFPPVYELSIVVIVLVLFSLISLWRNALDLKGVIAANIVGIAIFIRGGELGLVDFFVLVVMFVVAELSTRYARKKMGSEHGKRTSANVIGNSGGALIAILFGYQIAFFGAISAALADTVSSEFGMLSPKKPKLITTLKRVETGTDGGITRLGLAASFAGALMIGAIYFLAVRDLFPAIAIVAAGIIGSLVDSLLGAVFERKKLLNNMQVNFLATLAGGISAVLIVAVGSLLGL
ncbi:MAG: DUF92 domain-containing protein [Candidatus Diapherotrites archaeon]